MAYGWTVVGDNDRFVGYMEEAFRIAFEAGTPGKWLVDVLPVRKGPVLLIFR